MGMLLAFLVLCSGSIKVKHKYNHKNKVTRELREVINKRTGRKEILRTVRIMEYE